MFSDSPTVPSAAVLVPEGSEVIVEGIGVAPGVAIGPAYLYAGGAYQAEAEHLTEEGVEDELERFERAVARSERELSKIITIANEKLGGTSGNIFDAQLLILRDPSFYEAVQTAIEEEHMGAGYAVQTVLERVEKRLRASGSAALRERAADFQDIQNRVLRNLQQGRAISRIDPHRIVVAQNLTAADVLLFSRRGVLGCVLDFGGPTSHVSIMARALGVPAVVSLHDLAEHVRSDDTLIVDGFSGRVILNPTEETTARYEAKQARYLALQADRTDVVAAPSETLDGHPVQLQANLEFREELPLLHEYG
ncbi:MAG: phosphoenolpyruvate--protein phosphotransferase, partial [Rhodothermaceae bacterium]|nr:phosphoenolpyruvate--protein phosphotransferase [Rhodothermaceae bacterium]